MPGATAAMLLHRELKAKGITEHLTLHKRKVQPGKTSTLTAPRRPGEAKEKGPKQPTDAKKDPPTPGGVKRGPMKPGEVRKVSPKPGAAEKAPKKGSQTKDQEARLSEARKASQQPDKASQTLPSAPGSSGKSKVKGTRRSQDGEAHMNTKARSQSSKSTVPKGKISDASPAKKKESEVPKEAVAQGANVGPRVKAAASLRGGGSKTEHLARKTQAPKGPEGPACPHRPPHPR
ncbi:LOW QUALITY PROTEIN: histone H1.8-like [Lynx canadensis]|uniref:LOW QUALITY PROTEIN: histone H1.8-like n=1 Tax=Lynx canadensis TaxID=61383 RepID=UPI0011B0C1E9|nr:LOW QUALITY PROTEIN: histone H1.8-like [Lynx canadensis]